MEGVTSSINFLKNLRRFGVHSSLNGGIHQGSLLVLGAKLKFVVSSRFADSGWLSVCGH